MSYKWIGGTLVWGQEGSRLASGTFPPEETNNEGSLSSSYTTALTHQPASQQDISGLPHTIHTRKHYSIRASSEREYGSLFKCEETNFLAEWL
jgi:hypothetical protein